MIVMPILNTNKNGISKIYNVEVKLKNAQKVKTNTVVRGINESDVVINGTSFNQSIYNTKGIEPNVYVNFLRNFNYKANKKDFLISTREHANSDLYDLYNVPMPPRKIAAGLDGLYGSAILDMKKEIPDIKKGRYISLKKIGVDKHITEEKIDKLKYYTEKEKDENRRSDIFQLNGISDLEKTVDFMKLFDCTIINETTLNEQQLTDIIATLAPLNTKDVRNLARYYEIAKENKEVYSKLTKINKILYNKPLNLIQSKSKAKVLVKTNDNQKAA